MDLTRRTVCGCSFLSELKRPQHEAGESHLVHISDFFALPILVKSWPHLSTLTVFYSTSLKHFQFSSPGLSKTIVPELIYIYCDILVGL